jgi:hypothetical protein
MPSMRTLVKQTQININANEDYFLAEDEAIAA